MNIVARARPGMAIAWVGPGLATPLLPGDNDSQETRFFSENNRLLNCNSWVGSAFETQAGIYIEL